MNKLKALFFSLFIFACSSSVFAEPPAQLSGEMIQAGVIFGKTDPSYLITLDDKKIDVSPDGNFVFAFGRDAEKNHVIRIKSADGSKSFRKKLSLKDGNWDVQKIDGLPERKVNPSEEDAKAIKHSYNFV